MLRKHIHPSDVRTAVQTLLLIVEMASVGKNEISAAFTSEMKDFEDAVQVACAKRMVQMIGLRAMSKILKNLRLKS